MSMSDANIKEIKMNNDTENQEVGYKVYSKEEVLAIIEEQESKKSGIIYVPGKYKGLIPHQSIKKTIDEIYHYIIFVTHLHNAHKEEDFINMRELDLFNSLTSFVKIIDMSPIHGHRREGLRSKFSCYLNNPIPATKRALDDILISLTEQDSSRIAFNFDITQTYIKNMAMSVAEYGRSVLQFNKTLSEHYEQSLSPYVVLLDCLLCEIKEYVLLALEDTPELKDIEVKDGDSHPLMEKLEKEIKNIIEVIIRPQNFVLNIKALTDPDDIKAVKGKDDAYYEVKYNKDYYIHGKCYFEMYLENEFLPAMLEELQQPNKPRYQILNRMMHEVYSLGETPERLSDFLLNIQAAYIQKIDDLVEKDRQVKEMVKMQNNDTSENAVSPDISKSDPATEKQNFLAYLKELASASLKRDEVDITTEDLQNVIADVIDEHNVTQQLAGDIEGV